MNKDALLEKIESLEQENKKLKERLKKKSKRKNIKTPVKEIIEYWSKHQDECGLSVDWSEAPKDVGDVVIKKDYKNVILYLIV